jgi:hypothetical protein
VPTNANRAAPVGVAPQVIPAQGGAWHVYPNGRRVFVKARGTAGQVTTPGAPGTPTVDQGGTLTPDSQYFQWDAGALAKKQADLAGNENEGVSNRATLQSAFARLKAQQPIDQSNASSAANRQGLFYSSNLGNRLGDIAKSYVQQQGQAQTSYDQSERARLAARAAIEAGYGVDQAAQMAAAADRQINRDTTAADAGALVAQGTPGGQATTQAVTTTAPSVAYRTRTVNGRVLHVYPNRKKPVVVRRVARSR